MPAAVPLLVLVVSALALADGVLKARPVKPVRPCALVIPPPQVIRAPRLELVYRDGLPLGPGWLVVLDHLACD